MSMYYCDVCDGLKDNDYSPMTQDPCGLDRMVCDECAMDIDDDISEAVHEQLEGERMRRMGYEKDMNPYNDQEPIKQAAWLKGWEKQDFKTRVVAR